MPVSLHRLYALLLALPAGLLAAAGAAPPQRLSQTGLYEPGSVARVRADALPFTPQYPLWSDGAVKRRWLWLPPGSAIDGSQPDAWVFPAGTKLWKAFSHGGQAVETRYIERRADGSWLFATYVWADDGRDAWLAPERGIAAHPAPGAPGGRHAVPGRGDCLACHGDAPVPVLGASALQLSPDRDPLAAHDQPPLPGDVDLRSLVGRGWLRGLPPALLATPPRIAAASPLERATLGYLHGNCGHCHHRAGTQVPLALTLAQSAADPRTAVAATRASTVGAASRYTAPGSAAGAAIVAPGDSAVSVLFLRMQSRQPQAQMPPLGTHVPDPEGLALVQRWIQQDLPHQKETTP